MYFCDTHTHSLISSDSKATLAQMAAAATANRLDELCVTDHFDLLDWEGKPRAFFDWPAAKAQYRQVKLEYAGKLELSLGLEMGSAPYDPAAAQAVLRLGGEDLDFVLGSLHNWMGEEANKELYFTNFAGDMALCHRAVKNCLDHTWALVTQCPECYDSLAHIAYPLRYIRRDGMELSLGDYEEQVRAIFTEVARTDHALEINTHTGRDLVSWPPLLRWFKECGGKLVTVGSDAHRPEDLAKGIAEALEMVKAAGFGYVTTFRRRKPVIHPL